MDLNSINWNIMPHLNLFLVEKYQFMTLLRLLITNKDKKIEIRKWKREILILHYQNHLLYESKKN